MAELNVKKIENFLMGIMKIERGYANESKNARSNRKNDIREFLEKFTIEELENDNEN